MAQAAHIVGCPTYLVQRLTGVCVVDHYGAANYAPFYDVEKLAWNTELTRDTVGLSVGVVRSLMGRA